MIVTKLVLNPYPCWYYSDVCDDAMMRRKVEGGARAMAKTENKLNTEGNETGEDMGSTGGSPCSDSRNHS